MQWIYSNTVRHKLTMTALLTVLAAVTGPFGTHAIGYPTIRILYWAILIPGCGIAFHTIIGAFMANRRLQAYPRIVTILLGAAVSAVPGSALLAVVERFLRGYAPTPADVPWYWFCVWIIGTVVGCLWYLVLRPMASGELAYVGDRPDLADPDRFPFLARLPVPARDNLMSLSMNDHYVAATSATGTHMILMRFSRALEEMKDYPGVRIHRSHWVALKAVRNAYRTNKRSFVRLVDGRSLPVSETYREKVAEAFGPEV